MSIVRFVRACARGTRLVRACARGIRLTHVCALSAALSLVSLTGSAAFAADQSQPTKIGHITVVAAWSRATPIKVGGAFLTLRNDGDVPDRLVDVSTDVAQMAHLHQSLKQDGVDKMRAVDGIDLPPHATVKLQPGGYHVMLMGLVKPLKAGDSFPLTLTFAKAGKGTVIVLVKAAGASGAGDESGKPMDDSMGGMDMSHDTGK